MRDMRRRPRAVARCRPYHWRRERAWFRRCHKWVVPLQDPPRGVRRESAWGSPRLPYSYRPEADERPEQRADAPARIPTDEWKATDPAAPAQRLALARTA